MRFKKLFILPVLLLIPFFKADASVIHCNAPSSVNLGDTFNVTFSGSLSSSSSTWSGSIFSSSNVTYAGGDGLSIWRDGANLSHTVSFTANTVGTATFTVNNVDVSDENQEYSGSDTCSVSIVQPSAPSTSNNNNYNWYSNDYVEQSSNNNLKSLSIEGVTITPEFSNDVQEYSAIVEGSVDKVIINTEVEDDKSGVEGNGERALEEGINKIEVVVTAENGDKKVFTINVTRKEVNPIEVKINNKKYTVIKKEVKVDIPDGYEKTNITINKQEVEAFTNKKTKYTLVALVDEKGETSLFIYNQKNNSYIEYNELSSNVRIVLLSFEKELPSNYKKTTFKINKKEVDGYTLDKKSSYRILYGLNIETGEKDYYQYDMDEKTFQRYEIVKGSSKLMGNILPASFDVSYVVLILCGLLVLSVLFNIILLVSKNRLKKYASKNIKDNSKKEKELEKERKEFLDL